MELLSQYRGLRKENYVLAFGRLVTGLGSMAWPMMTLILSQKMQVNAQHISWLLSGAMIIMAPAVLISGKIVDKTDKKMIIVLLDLVSVVCFMICAFIPLSWYTIFLMFIGSVGQNMEHPAYSALTADITLTADRDRSFSLQYLCANLGLVLAPTVAGFLFKDYLWLVFFINSISILCSTLLIFFLVKDIRPEVETSKEAEYQKERTGESILRVLLEKKSMIIAIAVTTGYYAVYQMFVYLLPLDLGAIHGDNGALLYGSVTSINCIVVVLFTPVITKLFGRRPEPDRLAAGTFLMVLGFAIFVVFEGFIPMYYISMIILTWGEVFALTAENPYLTRRIPASHRGRVNGVITVIRTFFASVFQIIIGAVYTALGSRPAWAAVIAAGAVFISVSLILRRTDRSDYPNLISENLVQNKNNLDK